MSLSDGDQRLLVMILVPRSSLRTTVTVNESGPTQTVSLVASNPLATIVLALNQSSLSTSGTMTMTVTVDASTSSGAIAVTGTGSTSGPLSTTNLLTVR
jgi:hypothetical protein